MLAEKRKRVVGTRLEVLPKPNEAHIKTDPTVNIVDGKYFLLWLAPPFYLSMHQDQFFSPFLEGD